MTKPDFSVRSAVQPGVEAELKATDVSKRYGRSTWALRSIDLEIPPAGITALIGPNGAGKSTLMKAWVGFERPTDGSVAVRGIDPWKDRPAALRELAYVAQRPALYLQLSGREHFQLAAHHRTGFDERAAEMRLNALGIPAEQRAWKLSGGQQAQLALAIALGTGAPVLLLDEPLASLDPLARREFLQVLREAIDETNGTALLSSHVVTDVAEGCDRLVVMGVGQVLYAGDIAEAIETHSVSPAGPSEPAALDRIAEFIGPGGDRLLLRRHPPVAGGRAATLEEIVIGYLTAGRAVGGREGA